MRPSPFVGRATVPSLAALLVILILPAPALAHAEIETASPADQSTVSEPVASVSATYSEAMTADGSKLVVKDADGKTVASGGLDPADDRRMVAEPDVPLGDGTYQVRSTAIATDGHVEHATWTFTVAVVATAPPSPSPSEPSASSAASPSPTVSPSVAPSATATPTPAASADGEPASGSGSDALVPIVAALLIAGIGAAMLLRRRSQPGPS